MGTRALSKGMTSPSVVSPARRLGDASSPELDSSRRAAQERGQTAIAAGWGGQAAIFVVADTVKASSAEAVAS